VAPLRGPFALWDGAKMRDASLEGSVLLHSAGQAGSILLRGSTTDDVFQGYELMLDPRAGAVRLLRHDAADVHLLAEAKVPIETNQWYPVRFEFHGAHFRFWCGNGPGPLLECSDTSPILAPGKIGLRALGAGFSASDLTVHTDGHKMKVDGEETFTNAQARHRALQSFCLMLFNLNEFVYVD
jgi:hypothetical protein